MVDIKALKLAVVTPALTLMAKNSDLKSFHLRRLKRNRFVEKRHRSKGHGCRHGTDGLYRDTGQPAPRQCDKFDGVF